MRKLKELVGKVDWSLWLDRVKGLSAKGLVALSIVGLSLIPAFLTLTLGMLGLLSGLTLLSLGLCTVTYKLAKELDDVKLEAADAEFRAWQAKEKVVALDSEIDNLYEHIDALKAVAPKKRTLSKKKSKQKKTR